MTERHTQPSLFDVGPPAPGPRPVGGRDRARPGDQSADRSADRFDHRPGDGSADRPGPGDPVAVTRGFVPRGPGVPRWDEMSSPVGDILLVSDGDALTGLFLGDDHGGPPRVGPDRRRDPGALADAVRQLRAYFAGELRVFDLPLAPSGSGFQLAVWSALLTVGYARTVSYGDIAARIGDPRASRAVGRANNRNPLAIVVPCHRVVGADGGLTGYGGGLPRKRALLDLERRHDGGVTEPLDLSPGP